MTLKKILFVFLVLFSTSASSHAQRLQVVATIFPLGSIASEIGGNMVNVINLLKPGTGPHTFEPTPGDVRKISYADVVLKAGFKLDDWLEPLIESADSKAVVIDCSQVVNIPLGLGHTHGGKHKGGAINPHYWLDPTMVAEVAKLVSRILSRMAPEKKREIRKRTVDFLHRLKTLDKEIMDQLSADGVGKRYVAYHNAWGYFARRYGLHEVGLIEKAPGRAPSAKHMVGLVETIKANGVKSILVEPQFSSRLGRTLVGETGVSLVMVDPVGGVAGRMSYIELMRYNARKFVKALSLDKVSPDKSTPSPQNP